MKQRNSRSSRGSAGRGRADKPASRSRNGKFSKRSDGKGDGERSFGGSKKPGRFSKPSSGRKPFGPKREDGDREFRGGTTGRSDDRKTFNKDVKGEFRARSGDRPDRFKKRDGDFSDKRSPRPASGSRGRFSKSDDRPDRFKKRDGDFSDRRKAKPDADSRGSYRKSGDRPDRFTKRKEDGFAARGTRKPDSDSRGGFKESNGDRPARFVRKKDEGFPERRERKSDDRPRGEFRERSERPDDFKPRVPRKTDSDVRGEFKERSMDKRGSFTKRSDGDFKARRPRKSDNDVKGEFKERGADRSEGFTKRRDDNVDDRAGHNAEKDKGEFRERSNDRGKKFESSDSKWNRKEKHEFYGDRKKSKSFASPASEGGTRLNKYIANAGICSRREADELIGAGVISVNGEVVTEMGYKVQPGDVVKYNNEALKSERLVYILLNKPKDFITTTDDPENRKTVMSLIEKAGKERVYPVGRLDRNTTGVLLFTNDGDLAKKLTHPSFQVHKVYQVELDRAVKGADIESIREGIQLEDGMIKADEVVYTNAGKDVVGLELHSGKNRIVRRIFEHLGYEVKKLDRVVFAGLTKKDLPRGRWRFLSEMEVANLKMMTGKKS